MSKFSHEEDDKNKALGLCTHPRGHSTFRYMFMGKVMLRCGNCKKEIALE